MPSFIRHRRSWRGTYNTVCVWRCLLKSISRHVIGSIAAVKTDRWHTASHTNQSVVIYRPHFSSLHMQTGHVLVATSKSPVHRNDNFRQEKQRAMVDLILTRSILFASSPALFTKTVLKKKKKHFLDRTCATMSTGLVWARAPAGVSSLICVYCCGDWCEHSVH